MYSMVVAMNVTIEILVVHSKVLNHKWIPES
jgi:hypothetical protein